MDNDVINIIENQKEKLNKLLKTYNMIETQIPKMNDKSNLLIYLDDTNQLLWEMESKLDKIQNVVDLFSPSDADITERIRQYDINEKLIKDMMPMIIYYRLFLENQK